MFWIVYKGPDASRELWGFRFEQGKPQKVEQEKLFKKCMALGCFVEAMPPLPTPPVEAAPVVASVTAEPVPAGDVVEKKKPSRGRPKKAVRRG